MPDPKPDRVPLADAALALRLTYHQCRGRVLSGNLAGGRDDFGRWYVERESVEAAQKTQARTPTDSKRRRPR